MRGLFVNMFYISYQGTEQKVEHYNSFTIFLKAVKDYLFLILVNGNQTITYH